MKRWLLLLALSPCFAASQEALQKRCDQWVKRFEIEGLKADVTLAEPEELLLLSNGEPIYGFSLYHRGEFHILVLTKEGYGAMDRLAEIKRRSGRARERDQYDTVLHELTHLLLEIASMSRDAEEGVVDKITELIEEKRAN